MSIQDFFSFQRHFRGPATQAFAITPTDGADMLKVARRLYVLTPGNLCLTLRDDPPGLPSATIPVTAGQTLDISVRSVWATGTTATVLGLI